MFARLVRSRARFQCRSLSAVPESAVVARYSKNDCPKKVISLVTEPLAQPKGEDVTIKMLFSPINPVDLSMIQGTYPNSPSLPGIAGNEGLAEVIAVGPKAKIQVGDLVFPRAQGFGTWRTHATIPQSSLLVVPPTKGVQPEYLATMSSAPAAAWRMLHDFVNLKEGDVVIQNGANSMVGLSVVQICASLGVKTINIIRRRSDYPELVEKMKGYGGFIVCADDYIRTLEFRNLISDLPKPKLALNNVGGPTATEMIRFLAPGGTLVTYGGMSVQPVTVATSGLIFNDVNLRGFWLNRWYETHTDQERLDLLKELTNLVQNQKLRLWTERHSFQSGFQTALDRAMNSSSRDRKVLLKFE